ncbi:PREDICTED: uncharacterized protein LOC105143670 [Acromyrmex echinatior]|uniref:uncharacterized protein LOC105143670 n=1 Tax=Acromyrmex echinatior TaxID=103372 RepID=UPI000580CED1|nr:PREDICTED: uncharacterized protein LOC105143670 [Acromyrmex echinatior]
MGRITRSSTDQEKPQRKRRKKDLDRIHSKILQAKRKLDKIGRRKEQKRQGRAKICNRLLPEPAAGIYRNGAKGKDIQKAETLENTYHKARLKADALKLLNGDTYKSERIVEISIQNETIKQSTNKDCIQNNFESNKLCTQELSPVLGNRQSQNQKPCLAKKKGEENIFENTNFSKTKKQNINDKSRHIQKEDICKRRLFQNDKEPSETIITNSTEIFDDTDLTKENKTSDKKTELIGSKNNKDLLCDPLSRYMEFCKISAKNFEADILQNYSSDPVTSTIKKLKHAYADSFRQQLLRKKKKQELENTNPTHSVEHQAYVSSDTSQLSPVEFEVPKCSKNRAIAAHFQESVSHKDNKFHLQNTKLKKRDGTMGYNFTSCLLRNTVTSNSNINNLVVENCKNGDNKYSKQSKDICQLAKSTNLFVVNEKDLDQMDSQKNPNYVNHLLKNKRHDKVNFSFDIPDHKNSRYVDNNSKFLEKSIFLSDPVLSERHFSNDYCHEKLPITISDNCALNNISKKYNNKIANNCEVKNVKRVPAILRRCVDISINKPNHSVQINGDVEGLHKKYETNLFNRSNGIKKELCETAFPNSYTNFPTPTIVNAIVDQTKILEPQIGSMKIKDSQESQIEQINSNMHPKEYNERNEFHRYRNFLYPRPFEVSCNTNTEKLLQQEQISPDIRKSFYRSNNYHPINHLQSVSLSNSNVESTKQFSQTKLHVCEANKQELYRKNICDQNQNILFNNVNDRAIPPILNITQNVQAEKRSAESCQENRFGKTDVKCTKNQINENACHCNEQYIYFDSANCPRKYKEQAHRCHKETAQPESLCDTRGYNNSVDNCINLSSFTQNVPLLTLRQNDGLYMYPKAIDDQHRAVLLQNVTQPVKYLAVENGSNIQKIPVYINDRSVKVAENAPLKVIAVMDPSIQTKTFPQEIATKVVSLQTDNLHFNNFATRKISDQSYVKHLDSVNAILLNPDSQSNMWYAPNL